MAVSPSTIWFGRAVFGSLGLITTLIALLPLGLSAEATVMADLFFCLAFAWVMRRPSTAPIGLILIMALLADFLLMRPLGLWSFIILMASEFARSQRTPLREQMFIIEWFIFALVFAAALFVNMLILKFSFSPTPSFNLMFAFFVSTVAAYPIVVAILHWVFRIRAPQAPGGATNFGRVA